ncbi:MAG: LysM peptidoglycan-binding domain-containing protein, partial [Kiritimatiellae bacterium]|nr:LysM peptidoglycan-binding domain-containing protein [Kiritimatiellia bacterium]
PAPAPEPAASAAAAPVAAGFGSYVVQSGDILGRIARKHNVSEKAILEANPSVKDPNRIRVGQRLAIPAAGTGLNKAGASKVAKKAVAKAPAAAKKAAATLPEKPGFVVYVVKPGDILGRVAKSHGTSVKAIMEANNIVDDRKVRAGKAIYIPSSGASSAADSAVRGDVSPAPAVAEEPVAPRVGPAVPEFEPAAGASDPYLSL